nr:exportin-7 [Hydra vulgaris]
MGVQNLAELETFCEQLYQSSDPSVRLKAEEALLQFSSSSDCLQKCQYLLEQGTTSYTQLLAASTITKMITGGSSISIAQRVDIRNYVLNYFASRSKLVPFVVQALSQLLVKLTKFGWFESQDDNWVFRSITIDIKQFLQGSIDHCIIGVKLLTELVASMNQSEENLSLTKNRKISASFRDTALFEIFTSSLDMIKQVLNKKIDFQDQSQVSLLGFLLQLVRVCLMYDFIGTSFDESTDDFGTVHVPSTWKQTFLDFSVLHLFMDLYLVVPLNLSSLALSCYVQLASIRRSLFDINERTSYLQELMNGVKKILELPHALENTDNYHEFCRLLARIKANYQLGEIMKTDCYKEVMEMITKFTVTSLRVLHFAPNSLYYLLNMWQKMVSSCPFIQATDTHLLEQFTPEITEAYVTSRLESVKETHQGGLEDPLDDKATLHQQLDQISTIARCDYQKSCGLLMQAFDQTAQVYQELLSGQSISSSFLIQEGRMTWLVYIIGYCIGSRVSFSSTAEHDRLDGELSLRVLQLMNLTDMKLPQVGSEKLELALLTFFDQFKKIYIGDQINKSSKVYQVISAHLGIIDESAMLELYTRKIITNMKYWSHSEKIISATLNLLNDLSIGYSSVRKLVKLDAIQFVLNNHTSEHFPFLGIQSNAVTKCRSLFYTALGRFLLADIGDEEERFKIFTLPLSLTLENISTRITPNSSSTFDACETKSLIVGLCRDLRGLAFAFNTKNSFQMLFSWLYPECTKLIQRILEMSYHDPDIANCVLKLMCELTQNRSQRLQFDIMVADGILLFREISKTLVTYGSRIQTVSSYPSDKLYNTKLKGISICFNMLKAALSGGYVNFGVMRLYGDSSLDNAIGVFVKLLESVEQRNLLEYPKLSKSYYTLVETVTEHHIDHICKLDPQVLMYIISTVSEGLTALDLGISTGCCSALDHIISYFFTNCQKANKNDSTKDQHAALKLLDLRSEIFQQMLATIMNIVMFEDCRNMHTCNIRGFSA